MLFCVPLFQQCHHQSRGRELTEGYNQAGNTYYWAMLRANLHLPPVREPELYEHRITRFQTRAVEEELGGGRAGG